MKNLIVAVFITLLVSACTMTNREGQGYSPCYSLTKEKANQMFPNQESGKLGDIEGDELKEAKLKLANNMNVFLPCKRQDVAFLNNLIRL